MPKRKIGRASSRVRNLITICTLTAIVLSASTYAWFIGMRTVNVSSFDVEIAAIDGLSLSLDGEPTSFGDTVTISQLNHVTASYDGNTNSWGGEGLIPMSSIGEMDGTVSRMKLFEKASLTATPGGYRLMASRVLNDTVGSTEQDGYVAFDLFVKNESGTQYIEGLEPKDEESIYLTIDSGVTVASDGVANTGIENSVRVAFTQIGRVIATTNTQGTITAITCTTDENVTGICRNAQIWEPNDTKHVQNAINWYTTSCKARIAEDVRAEGSYSGSCNPIFEGLAYPTYAVKSAIASSDNVDIYDGLAYNTYEPEAPAVSLLDGKATFTDTEKLYRGTSRQEFMSLAPNSITKVRVYIYIEGQDVDNYDFASIGKKISVKFGFTKQRYTEDDIDYEGPDVNQGEGPLGSDKTAPVITLTPGETTVTITEGTEYTDPTFTAVDNVDEDVSGNVVVSGTVNTDEPGTYTRIFSVRDLAGNTGTKAVTVIVTPNAG